VTTKTGIVAQLGEQAVLLPGLIGKALAANDRIKLRLSLLQDAGAQVQEPGRAARPFGAGLREAGLGDEVTETCIADARLVGAGRLYLPGALALVAGLKADLTAMLAPLQAADAAAAAPFAARLEALAPQLAVGVEDQIGLDEVSALATASRGGADSVHLLVMDMHKALNRLAADSAVETLDGARIHAVSPEDRHAIKAFMRGLNRTAPLAFGHPGLETTAVRTGGHLTIQNDIGTTDAHVLVVHVDDEAVSVTYTDIHRVRAKFFIAMFDGQGAEWSPLAERQATGLEEDAFYLITGRFTSGDASAREKFLEFLGSRIVFLIDWNKARKALQIFVGKKPAVALLSWAAAQDYGHRAFIELGGAELVFDAVQRGAAGRIRYGVRLDEALGEAECAEFLRHVLSETSQGLAAGRGARLVRDEIQADLSRRFESAEGAVFSLLVCHLGLTRFTAEGIALQLTGSGGEGRDFARRAKLIEEKADRLTAQLREMAASSREGGQLRLVIDAVENTADALEDCAFLFSLAPTGPARPDTAPLTRLADIVIDSISHMVRAVEAASRLPDDQRADAAAALQAVDAVVGAERAADTAEREAFATFMAVPQDDARRLTLSLEIARALEQATDHLSHAAFALRERVLEELSA
jgi:uncharacterized protein Yka (UPF0111/DUF47 family)